MQNFAATTNGFPPKRALISIVLTGIFCLFMFSNGTAQEVVSDQIHFTTDDGAISLASIIKSETKDALYVDLLTIENSFARAWLYHALHSKKALAISAEPGAQLLVSAANSGRNISEIKSIVEDCLKEAMDLDGKYDKDVKGSLFASIEDIHGDDALNYIFGGDMRGGQSDSCHKSLPFCTGTQYSFPAGYGSGSAQSGPNYGCLGNSKPSPVWYHMKIKDPGDITIKMVGVKSNGGSLDIDFALWGPFSDPVSPCTAQLTANCSSCPNNTDNMNFYPSGNLHDCSWSSSSIEHAHIKNGKTGEYYLMIITNWSNVAGTISFEKTTGNGTTDCSILPPPASNNSPLCIGQTIWLTAASVVNATYNWTGPNGFTSNVQNPQINNAKLVNSGVYSLTITVAGQTSDPTTTEVIVVNPPVGSLSGGAAICKGESTQLTVTASGTGPYSAAIGIGIGSPININFSQSPHVFSVSPQSSTVYTLASISNIGCSGATSGQAEVTVRPLPQPVFIISSLCSGKQITFTDQSSIIGGNINSWAWDLGDGTSSAAQNPVHVYENPDNYTIKLTVTSAAGCSASITQSKTIAPTPLVSAGSDKTIAFGTSIRLDGSASGGSGSHAYQWIPANKVDNPGVLTPNTTQLQETTNYTLFATDNGNGCQNSDVMTVTVTGGAMAAMIEASPSEICIGGSTLLSSTVSGGSGNYTYTWTSEPPGYSSPLPDITVQPVVNTTYKLKIFDGYSEFNTQIFVAVHSLPQISIHPVEPILHGTNTLLSSNITSGAQPFTYLWKPESNVVESTAAQTQTVNLYQSQSFTLKVTDNNGCVSNTQTDVTITGTELEVNPITENPVICLRETAVLRAVPGGGSNDYVSYIWTGSDGFHSNEKAPQVSPIATTLYTVIVDDGFNTAEGQVSVTVLPLPAVDLVPYHDERVQNMGDGKIGICVYDTVTLDAGNPGHSYVWSNGSTNRTINISTSGLSFDEQFYDVWITNIQTGCRDKAEIRAFFTFQNCSYGIEKHLLDDRMNVYPNPSRSGNFTVALTGLRGEKQLRVYSLVGRTIHSQTVLLQSDGRQEISIDLSSFAPGVYFLKLSGEREVLYRPMIVSE